MSDNQVVSWLEHTRNEMIVPGSSTSRRSNAIIDFGITHDATDWYTDVLDERTSDHFPILMQSPLCISQPAPFRVANWNIFNFFLQAVYEY
jgi:hypothetical protein